jgi:hypothetical protein
MSKSIYSFFDFLNSINGGQKSPDLFSECRRASDGAQIDTAEKQYVPFMINRGLSYFRDTVLYANEMNRLYRLSPVMQYDFLKNIIRPGKRFSKWFKMEEDEDVKVIMAAYGYSYIQARKALPLLSSDQIDDLKKYLDRGGLKKR